VTPAATSRRFDRQKRVLSLAYWLFKPVAWFFPRIAWVVGVEEIALMTRHIANALSDSRAVVHRPHPFYEVEYDYVIQHDSSRLAKYRRLYGGPLLLAWLANRAHGFIYVGGAGFLDIQDDQREFEFSFLKRHKRKIVCYFTGSDIRSPRRMHELAEQTQLPNIGSLMLIADPVYATDEYDAVRRERSRIADTYADRIFTAGVDQLSYLTSPTEPFRYFYPDDAFAETNGKFENVERFIIVHAPSNPRLKGTEYVHEAIDRLSSVRDDFEYREITGSSNAEVIDALSNAHIVLNQFHAFVPGVFGIEALAHRCAMLTSADERLEPDLDADANEAWVVTRPNEIFDHLTRLLDNPSSIREQAERGFEWARKNAAASVDGRRVRAILDQL
jgi:hypothetical protein